jgi:lipopolysaccharide biosynthesis regulator YciM
MTHKTDEDYVEEFMERCTVAETGWLHIEKHDHDFLEDLLRNTLKAVHEETLKKTVKEIAKLKKELRPDKEETAVEIFCENIGWNNALTEAQKSISEQLTTP